MSFDKFQINTNDPEIKGAIPDLINLATQNDVRALCLLGDYLEKNIIIYPNDSDKAFKLYERAAKLGNTNAMFKAGSICEEKGLEDNAITWYKKAVENGYPQAKYNLANLLAEQVIINFDQQKFDYAMELLFNAAADNIPEAQVKVAEIYEYIGENALALFWSQAAANQDYNYGLEMKNKLLGNMGVNGVQLSETTLLEAASYQKFESVCKKHVKCM